LEQSESYWSIYRFRSKAAKLFEGLLETDNETLKVLDISWNNLGEDRDPRHVGILCEMLARNKNIVHFDLSNNNFTL